MKHAERKDDDGLRTIGNVVLLKNFKDKKNAPPSLVVERINDNCKWDVDLESKCVNRLHGFACYRKKKFIVSTPGSKHGWGVCFSCLGEFCASILERPQAEADKIAQEQIEIAMRNEAKKQAKDAHEAAKLCTGYSKGQPFSLCPRKPKLTTQDGRRYCGRHAVRVLRRQKRLLKAV